MMLKQATMGMRAQLANWLYLFAHIVFQRICCLKSNCKTILEQRNTIYELVWLLLECHLALRWHNFHLELDGIRTYDRQSEYNTSEPQLLQTCDAYIRFWTVDTNFRSPT
jgi:hypothetical protein